MKASEYIQQHGDFEITEELEKCIPHKPKTVWDLRAGDKCYCVDAHGKVFLSEWIDEDRFGKCKRSLGLVTLTKEELEFKIESMKVYEELKRFAKEFTDEEWMDGTISKWSIYYDFYNKQIEFDMDFTWKYNYLHFESEKKAKEAIAAVGEERVKKYYLGVGK